MPPAPPSPTQLERDVLIGLIRRDAVPPRACTWHQVRVCKRPNSSLLQLSPAYSKASITYLDTIAAVGITGEDYLPRLSGKKNLIIHFITAGREWRRGGGSSHAQEKLGVHFLLHGDAVAEAEGFAITAERERRLAIPAQSSVIWPSGTGGRRAKCRRDTPSVFGLSCKSRGGAGMGGQARAKVTEQGGAWLLLIYFSSLAFFCISLLFSQSLSVSPYPPSASLFLSLLLYPPHISPYLPPYLPLPFPPPPLSLSKPSSPLFLSLTPLLSI